MRIRYYKTRLGYQVRLPDGDEFFLEAWYWRGFWVIWISLPWETPGEEIPERDVPAEIRAAALEEGRGKERC